MDGPFSIVVIAVTCPNWLKIWRSDSSVMSQGIPPRNNLLE